MFTVHDGAIMAVLIAVSRTASHIPSELIIDPSRSHSCWRLGRPRSERTPASDTLRQNRKSSDVRLFMCWLTASRPASDTSLPHHLFSPHTTRTCAWEKLDAAHRRSESHTLLTHRLKSTTRTLEHQSGTLLGSVGILRGTSVVKSES